MLARTQFNDRLAELPTAGLGVPSAQQLPGSGLSGDNLQKGGIATVSPIYSQTTVHSDSDSDKDVTQPNSFDHLKNAANLGFQANANMHNINSQTGDVFNQGTFNQGQLFSQPSPTVASSLVGSVRDHVDKLGIGSDLQAPSPTELLETLTEQMNEAGIQNNDNINPDIMGMLTALKELKGDSNTETKSNDNFNIASPGMMNVNPTAQTIFNPEIKPQTNLHPFKSHDPTFRQDLLSPTTVSPIMDTFIGQENKNYDDSSSVSETIKDLLHDVTGNSDSSQKELSDSAKDMLKDIQPTEPSHSETLEALSDKLSGGFTTPATNMFNDNFQMDAKTTDDSDSNSFSAVDPISNSKDLSDKLTEMQNENLSTDKLMSDDNKNIDFPSPTENNDLISEIIKSDSDSLSKTTTDDSDPLVLNKDSDSDQSSDDSMGQLEKTRSELPLTDDSQAIELTETMDVKSASDDSISQSDDKNMHLNKDMLDILNSNTDITTDDTDKNAESIFQAVPANDIPTLHEAVADLKDKHEIDDSLKLQTNENDSSVLYPSTNGDGDSNGIVETVEETQADLSSNDIPKVKLPSTDFNDDETIVENLKDYLSLTKSNNNKQGSDDTLSIDSTSGGVSFAAGKDHVSDESDVLQKETETDQTNESSLELIPETEDKIKIMDMVNTSEDIDDSTPSESSDLTVNQHDDINSQIPAQDNDDKVDFADIETAVDGQTSVLADDTGDQVEQLLEYIKRNTTEAGVDENENIDNLKSELEGIKEQEEHSDAISNDDGKELDSTQPSDSILTNEDSISDHVDDIPLLPDSETEETLNDGSDLLENYNKMFGNNEQDADVIDDGIVEEINDHAETGTEIDHDTSEKIEIPNDFNTPETAETEDHAETVHEIENDTTERIEMPDGIDRPDAAEADDIIEKVEEIMGTDADTSLDDIIEKVEEKISNDVDTSLDDSMDDMPSLAEGLSPENEKTAILPTVGSQEMELATCRQKLPSVCFSYQLEVMSKGTEHTLEPVVRNLRHS